VAACDEAGVSAAGLYRHMHSHFFFHACAHAHIRREGIWRGLETFRDPEISEYSPSDIAGLMDDALAAVPRSNQAIDDNMTNTT
jgi:hypothetical protein